jgi:mono/diheme cytochrome c family protein
MRRLAVLVALLSLVSLAACNEAQDPQKRYGTFSAAVPPWPGSSEALQLPEGVVSQDDLAREAAAVTPPQVTPSLLARGRERFGIYCSPCHGYDGYADGIVVARGFPRPPSFHSPQLRAAPAQLFFDTITNGYGAMYSYADRVAPSDRWAIVVYIRALQLSQLEARNAAP